MRKVKSIQERMAQIRAAQQSGAYTLCPRCGEATMKPELHTNALSRQYDIMICDLCYPRNTVIRGNMVRESSVIDYSE